jgi:murein L,D-transpeptidase YafK
MRITTNLFAFLMMGLFYNSMLAQSDFLAQQKKHERVRKAIEDKQVLIEKKLKSFEIQLNNVHILFVAFKDVARVDLYGRKQRDDAFRLIRSFPVCAASGDLGPKRKEGDMQVPEGFYFINRFNPVSNFYLSLGLNYPNASDKLKSTYPRLGGDIFIHGSCVTIGCLPMTDDLIKEIYLYAIHAKNNGQERIPVYIFPFEMTDQNMMKYREKFVSDAKLLKFWDNLKPGYDAFMQKKKELKFGLTTNGDYSY